MSLIFRTSFVKTTGGGSQIVFSDGSKSEVFFSKEIGLYILGVSLEESFITNEEFVYLKSCIFELKIPDKEDEVVLECIIQQVVEEAVEKLCNLALMKQTSSSKYVN